MQGTDWEKEEYISARKDLLNYYHHIDRDGFKYLCNDFPPFIKVNGRAEGPLAELMNDIAADLGVKADYRRCSWDDFAEVLAREQFATVAVPIMPIHQRFFRIVPAFTLKCGALFYSLSIARKTRNAISRNIRRIHSHLSELRGGKGEIDSHIEAIDSALHGIADASDKGFAAGKQYFEYLLLQHLDAPISKDLKGPPLADEALVAADDGFLCAIDLTTLRQIEKNIGTEKFTKEYSFVSILGSGWINIPAGLPFRNKHFGTYLQYRLRYNIGGCWSRLVSFYNKEVNQSEYSSPLSFDIFEWDKSHGQWDTFANASPRKRHFLQCLADILPPISDQAQLHTTLSFNSHALEITTLTHDLQKPIPGQETHHDLYLPSEASIPEDSGERIRALPPETKKEEEAEEEEGLTAAYLKARRETMALDLMQVSKNTKTDELKNDPAAFAYKLLDTLCKDLYPEEIVSPTPPTQIKVIAVFSGKIDRVIGDKVFAVLTTDKGETLRRVFPSSVFEEANILCGSEPFFSYSVLTAGGLTFSRIKPESAPDSEEINSLLNSIDEEEFSGWTFGDRDD